MADHWGKIACHFPARGNPNADVWGIEFLPKGGSSTVEIDRVYMIPPGVSVTSVAELQHYIVWTTDVTLVPENDTLCIEYTPNVDIPLSNVAVFSVDNESSDTVNFAIYHESGLVVAKSNQASHSSMSKFGQTGNRWLTAASGVTLKKGFKYYIQFTNNNATIKSVAMDGWYGNYKQFYHGQAQNKSVANINNTRSWIGDIGTAPDIFALQTNDFFMWQSSDYSTGLTNGHIYTRSNVGAGMPYGGVIGNQQSPSQITASDITNLLSKSAGSAIMWYIANYPSMNTGTVWQIPNNMPTETVDFTGYDNGYPQLAHVLYLFNQGNTTRVICNGGSWMWGTGMGRTFSYKTDSGYVNMITSDGPISSLPSDPVENGVYFTNEYGWPHFAIWEYNEGSQTWGWNTSRNAQDTADLLMDITSLDNLLTYVGKPTDLVSDDWDSTYQSDGLRTQTVYTDQKYYLEINGTEV